MSEATKDKIKENGQNGADAGNGPDDLAAEPGATAEDGQPGTGESSSGSNAAGESKNSSGGAAGEGKTGGAAGEGQKPAGGKRVVDSKVLEQRRKKRRRTRIIVIAVVAVLLIVAAVILLKHFGIFEKLKKRDPDEPLTASVNAVDYLPKGSFMMTAVDGCLIVIDENGITGVDEQGKWKWNSTLNALNPAFSASGKLLLVTDQGGKSLWAFEKDGFVWRYISENPLICAYASDSGSEIITVCEQEDFESSVTLLAVSGSKLTDKFTRKFGTYRMLCAAETADSSQLCASGVYYSGGSLSGVAVFMRVTDGEVYASLLSEKSVYLQLTYLNDGTLFAANSDSLKLVRKLPQVSGAGDAEKSLWERSGSRTMIVDTAKLGTALCAVAFCEDNSSGGGLSGVAFYDRSGERKVYTEIRGSVKGLETRGEQAAVFTEDTVYLISKNGVITGEYKFDTAVADIAFMGEGSLAVNTSAGMFIVSFSRD